MKITIMLRLAIANDFKTFDGKRKIGMMYFLQSAHGHIETTPHFLNDDTNVSDFKNLFNHNQIYVAKTYLDPETTTQAP